MKECRRSPSPEAPLLLVTATLQEMRAVLQPLGGQQRIKPLEPHFLKTRTRQYVLLITGVGPVNAALSLGRIMGSDLELRGVLNFGIGGSFDAAGLPLLSQVIIQEEIWPELGIRTASGTDIQALSRNLGEGQEILLRDRLFLDPQEAALRFGLNLPSQWPRVSSLTVAGVTGTRSEAEAMLKRYAVQAENMEGFALAWCCIQEGLPFLEVRTISNLVGSRQTKDWDLKGSLRGLGQMSRILLG